MFFNAIYKLSNVALKMAKVSARGKMGSTHRREGRMALVLSKLTVITSMWASLNEGSFMGI